VRLSFADAELSSLDALTGVESACLFVFEDERPLRGLAGLIDWRLCGRLSRILMDGRFVGAAGDALLFPVEGIGPGKLFCFGSGLREKLGAKDFGEAARRAGQALTKAGVESFATSLPAMKGTSDKERAEAFLSEGVASFKGKRLVLFGDARALRATFHDVAKSMKGLEIDKEPLSVQGRSVSGVAGTSCLPSKRAAGG